MVVKIQEFMQNVYHFIMEILEKDSILKITSKKGNVVILSEMQYNTMMGMVEENLGNATKTFVKEYDFANARKNPYVP